MILVFNDNNNKKRLKITLILIFNNNNNKKKRTKKTLNTLVNKITLDGMNSHGDNKVPLLLYIYMNHKI